ncbi:hypothetical protein LLH23_02350 [bacterium]|nr:hypothetical protein [bacterium]
MNGVVRRIAEKLRWAWRRRRGEDKRGDDLAERLGQIEEKLREIEASMQADGGGATVTTGSQQAQEERGPEVWEAAGTTPRPLVERTAVLAKAQRAGDIVLAGDEDVADETMVEVRPGMPQGLPGQQARRKAARFWEGVL